MKKCLKYKLPVSEAEKRNPSLLHAKLGAYLAEQKYLTMEEAMDIYYRSQLADQIDKGIYGIENMDYKYLVHDLIVNEPELFEK